MSLTPQERAKIEQLGARAARRRLAGRKLLPWLERWRLGRRGLGDLWKAIRPWDRLEHVQAGKAFAEGCRRLAAAFRGRW